MPVQPVRLVPDGHEREIGHFLRQRFWRWAAVISREIVHRRTKTSRQYHVQAAHEALALSELCHLTRQPVRHESKVFLFFVIEKFCQYTFVVKPTWTIFERVQEGD